jgi:cytochrome c2
MNRVDLAGDHISAPGCVAADARAQRSHRALWGAVLAAMIGLSGSWALAGTGADKGGDGAEAKKIFNQSCTGCHTYGKGIKVGPDLKGVTERRSRPWLLKFVRSSQQVIRSGDPTAQGLFQQFKQQRMPDWSALSEQQITAVLDWFATNGPEQKAADEYHADTATPADIERARGLFHGSARLANGGAACSSCHSVQEGGETTGGSLGPNLTTTYVKYQDKALTLFLKQPCFHRAPESSQASYLTPQESFAIKAYLRKVSLSGETAAK